jgi:hypothetical protein
MIPDANQAFLLRTLFIVLSLENKIPPKREFFAEVPRAPGFDFECPFVLLKDGLKKSNPTITANYHRISTLISSGFLREASQKQLLSSMQKHLGYII